MGAAGSVNKVFWSELDIALHETALDLLGAEAELESRWLDGYTFSLSGPIYAGTNEIQRNIVAERILGLPREPKGRRDEVRARRPTSATSRPPSTRCWPRPTPPPSPGPGPTATTSPGSSSGRGWPSRASPCSPPRPRRSRCASPSRRSGRHAVPGPWVESAAYLPVALGREVEGVATVAVPPHVPYALDADVADQVYVGDTLARRGRRDARVRRPHPAALRGDRRRRDRTARRSTWRCSRPRPSCSAPASGCSPTRSPT